MIIIDAAYNDIDDIKDVCRTVRNWYYLREVTFMGNPVAKRHRYREDIIANSAHLGIFGNENKARIYKNNRKNHFQLFLELNSF